MDPTAAVTPPDVPGYRLGECLGRGATGTVWAALRSRDLVPVAVKVVAVGRDGGAADQAARELAILGRVAVEGLVGFHEAIGLGTDPPSIALVLDHVAGGSLWSAVRARGHLSVGESVTVLVPVARALAGLHAAAVVHGDVSPRNVLLQRTGQPVLSDLGVARLTGASDAQAYGTTGFIAPEVEAGGPPTPASDVYAVGALAWWCVTGDLPTPASLQRPVGSLVPGLPPSWCEVTAQALDRDPAARPAAAELALAYFDSASCEPLRLVVGADDTSLLTHRLRRTAPPAPPARPAAASPPAATGWRGHPLRWVAAGVGAAVGVGLVLAGVAFADRLPGRDSPHAGVAPRSGAPAVRTPVAQAPLSLSGSPTVAQDLTANRAAAGRDPRGLMQALADLRARAMTSRAASDLVALDVPGSAAMHQDTAMLADLTAHQRSYRDVALHVRTARCVDCTTSVALIDAAVDTTAYTVVDPSGVARHERLPPAPVMRFSLRWQDDRWRIERVSAL